MGAAADLLGYSNAESVVARMVFPKKRRRPEDKDTWERVSIRVTELIQQAVDPGRMRRARDSSEDECSSAYDSGTESS